MGVLSDGTSYNLTTGQPHAICFSSKDYGADALSDLSPTLRAGGHDGSHANAGVPPAIAFSIMPMNSGKDFKGRETDVAQPVMAAGPAGGNQGGDYVVQPVAFALRGRDGGAMPEIEGDGSRAGALRAASGGSSRDYVAFAIQERAVCENPNAGPDGAGFRTDDAAYTLEARTVPQAVAFMENQRGEVRQSDITNLTVGAGTPGQGYPAAFVGSAVRRLTPRECERLQGFPDDFTLVPHRGKPAADGPRYKALGNSMAVPVMRWIGERIAQVEAVS
jgi:DNA (cytosine-5)-methyltransferase 1